MNIQKILFIMFSLSLTLPAFGIPFAQRNCKPDDINISPGSNYQTTCIWEEGKDSTMQVTLHAEKAIVPLINATCIFSSKDKDVVSLVIGKKAADVRNVHIKGNVISFDIINKGIDANLNVMFYLNNRDGSGPYTPGNQLLCSFTPPAEMVT